MVLADFHISGYWLMIKENQRHFRSLYGSEKLCFFQLDKG